MVDGRVVLEREELGHAHGAGRADARQIVSHQVHDHQVLGPILGALGQRQAERGVVLGADTARARPLDGARLDVSADVHAQKALRRRAEHDGLRKVQVRGERGGVSRAETAVERPRRLVERRFEALRQVGLKDVAGEDVLAHAGDRVEVAAVGERRAKREARVPPPALDRIGRRGLGAPRGRRSHRDRGAPSGWGGNRRWHVSRPQALEHCGGAFRRPPSARVRRRLRQTGRDQPRALDAS